MADNSGKRKWLDRLRNRYRLVVMNDDTFEERFSLRLTPLGFLILIGSVSIVMVILVISLVAFTPLREYIPGYADVQMRRDIDKMMLRSDSIEREAAAREAYLKNIATILSGNDKPENPANPKDTTKNYSNLNFRPSKEDSMLREEIESQDQYTLTQGGNKRGGINSFFFFAPVKGPVTSAFNATEEHFGVDVAAAENEAIKATLDGTVISSGWTSEFGYVIEVQHGGNIISVYKHNSALLKKTGQYVKAGEPIAVIGNSGEQSTGPHLHFELWYNGTPVDPQEYMGF